MQQLACFCLRREDEEMVCTRTRCVCVRSDEQTCKEVCLARLSCVLLLLIWHAVSSPLAITCTADVSSSESVRAVAFCFVALCRQQIKSDRVCSLWSMRHLGRMWRKKATAARLLCAVYLGTATHTGAPSFCFFTRVITWREQLDGLALFGKREMKLAPGVSLFIQMERHLPPAMISSATNERTTCLASPAE